MAPTPVKAAYWFPNSGIPVGNINSSLFTYLFCGYADVDPNTYEIVFAAANLSDFSNFTQKVRTRNPSVKTLLSVGGGSDKAEILAAVAKERSTRKSFIDSSIQKARSYNFHGLDLSWQYPSTDRQMTDFGTLLREWKAAIDSEANDSGKEPLLLTAVTYFQPNYEGKVYSARPINEYLDWINIRAYDFYSPVSSPLKTGPHATLRNSPEPFTVVTGVEAWIKNHVPAEKLVLGLAFHGFAWRLKSSNNNGIFAPADGSANGDGIGGNGLISYKKVKEFINREGANSDFDSLTSTDYCSAGNTWISYEDKKSIIEKVRYAVGKKLGGYFASDIGGDENWTLSQEAYRAGSA